MKIIQSVQGSQQWLAERAKPNTYTASEAPAAMGDSKHQTRPDLLKQKATGIVPEVSPHLQAIFDRGHAAEEAARPIVQGILGEELYPVTGVLEVDGMRLLASFDGINMLGDLCWENKLFNAGLADAVRAGHIEPHYYWQLEQQLLVSGAARAYFTTSDGTPENTVGMWYESQPERRAALIAGWKQFAEDLANYQHTEQTVAPVAAPIESLPALAVSVSGSISLTHNLERFGQRLAAFVQDINTKPQTDQDFVNLDAAVKVLREAETALDSAESNALAQTASIADMCNLVARYRKLARDNRLMFEKLVKSEKDNRRAEIVRTAQMELASYITKLNERIGGNWMPNMGMPFADAIKGLKSLDSMRDKVAGALRFAKIEANEIADRIEANKKAMGEHAHLFNDFSIMCTKDTADFANLVQIRIESENRRVTAERERIRQEEAAKLEAERANAASQALALDGAAGASVRNDQWGKADAVVGTVSAQPEAASTPPIAYAVCEQHTAGVDDTMIDDFIRLLPATSAAEKKTLRVTIQKWEKYRIARAMQAAA